LATGTRLTADRSSLAVGPTEMGSESIKISTLSLSNLENPKLDSAQDATPFSWSPDHFTRAWTPDL